MRLTLLIPELLWSEPGDSDAWAAADQSPAASLLARRPPPTGAPCAWENAALGLAGLPGNTSLATLRAAGETNPPPLADDDAHWLCADPVHLRFHQDRLILADAADLALSADELSALSETLNRHLAPNQFHFAAPDRGYLRLPEPAGSAQRPVSQKVGCEVRPADLGADAELRRLGNEIQMLLHDHPVNRRREAARMPAVNALWLWGEGHQPVAAASSHPLWLAHGEAATFVEGLARRTAAGASVLRGALPRPTADTIVFSGALLRAAQYQDSAAWLTAWKTIDSDLLAPAMAHLRSGAIAALDIVAPTIFGELRWSIAPGTARLAHGLSFIRKPKPPLSSLAAAMARHAASKAT